jgi:hypothetical protein
VMIAVIALDGQSRPDNSSLSKGLSHKCGVIRVSSGGI